MFSFNYDWSKALFKVFKEHLKIYVLVGIFFSLLSGGFYILDKFLLGNTLWLFSVGVTVFMALLIVLIGFITLFWAVITELFIQYFPEWTSILKGYLKEHSKLVIGTGYLGFTILYLFIAGVYGLYIFPQDSKIGLELTNGVSSMVSLDLIIAPLLLFAGISLGLMWIKFYTIDWGELEKADTE